jgi:hypothetical protein
MRLVTALPGRLPRHGPAEGVEVTSEAADLFCDRELTVRDTANASLQLPGNDPEVPLDLFDCLAIHGWRVRRRRARLGPARTHAYPGGTHPGLNLGLPTAACRRLVLAAHRPPPLAETPGVTP